MELVFLPKEQWKGQILPIGYTTEQYYDVAVQQSAKGFTVSVELRSFHEPLTISPEKYDFPDSLYQDHWEEAKAYGFLDKGKLVAAIELCPENWSNRLRVTELWVDQPYQKQGFGKQLMNLAKETAQKEGNRVLMLETQSCNVNAIGFYLHEGFTLIGFDACCYSNQDLERKEVRLELGWFPDRADH